MRLRLVRFCNSVTFNGSETHHVQSYDPADARTYASDLRRDGDDIRWGATGWAPVANVRQAYDLLEPPKLAAVPDPKPQAQPTGKRR